MVSLAICFTVKILPIITIILYFSVSRFACVSNVELEHYSAHCKPTKLKNISPSRKHQSVHCTDATFRASSFTGGVASRVQEPLIYPPWKSMELLSTNKMSDDNPSAMSIIWCLYRWHAQLTLGQCLPRECVPLSTCLHNRDIWWQHILYTVSLTLLVPE